MALSIERSIHLVRGHRVLLDVDLAQLYGIQTKMLNRAVKRNRSRFPEDFMFQLTTEEGANLKCQFGTSSRHGGRRRSQPFAFTEHGVVMISNLLRSPRAISVSIEVVRVFVRLRQVLAANADLARRLNELERMVTGSLADHEQQFRVVFAALRQLMDEEAGKPPARIGFEVSGKAR